MFGLRRPPDDRSRLSISWEGTPADQESLRLIHAIVVAAPRLIISLSILAAVMIFGLIVLNVLA